MLKLSDTIERKFIDTIDISDWEIETDTGFQSISQIHQTIEYDVWYLETENYLHLECADDHILFDENFSEVFIKNLVPNVSYIQTKYGPSLVTKCYVTTRKENMFDITVDSDNHRFYSNDILSHNTITISSYILWYVFFNADKTVAILANKGVVAREILSKIVTAYKTIPFFLQPGATTFNKGSIELGNNSRIIASSTSSSSIRGFMCNFLYLDEFAFVEGADEFFTSTFPVVSSGTSSKVVISSTPRGLNLFYRIYKDATEKRNEFFPIEVHWSDVPGRDQKWKEQMVSTLTESGFRQEYGNEFLGSADTLIKSETLRSLRFNDPLHDKDGFRVFEEPKKNQKYFMMVDVARGVGKNYSAFIIVNVSEIPYKVVATFKRNDIVPMAYPTVISKAARKYNEAQVLVEINDVGGQIVDILYHDLEYENILSVNNTNDQILTTGLSSEKFKRGIRTTRTTKRLGCSNMKTLVEGHKVVLNDFELISELSTFVLHPDGKYGAEEGYNDDLAMCLVLFGWLAAQKNFSEYTDNSIRKELIKETEEVVDRDLLPIGFFGSYDDDSKIEGDPDNDFWQSIGNYNNYF